MSLDVNGDWWAISGVAGRANQSVLLAHWGVANWKYPLIGDFNGDGLSDVAAMDGANGNWYVGLQTSTGVSKTAWTSWGLVNWLDVSVGDVNGDGKADIIGRYFTGSVYNWYVATSSGSGFATSYFGAWGNVVWADVKVGDFNGDGKTDVAGRWTNSGGADQWWVGTSTGTSFVSSNLVNWGHVTWSNVVVGDFNGNGTTDIAGLWANPNPNQWWVSSTGATTNTAAWDAWGNVPWTNVMAADINGDGKADIIGRVASGQFAGQWYVANSNGNGFTTSLLDTWDPNISWSDVVVGDFNGDGKMDIAARTGSGSWYFSYSTGTSLVHANSPITTLALNYVFSGVGKLNAALFR